MNVIRRFTFAFLASLIVYISCFLVIYKFDLNQLILQSEDYLGTATVPFSILEEGNFDVDEYYDELTFYYPHPDDPFLTPYYLTKNQGHYYSIRPVLTSLIALPVYVIPVIFDQVVNIDTIRIASRLGGAFITALSAGFFMLVLHKLIPKDLKNSGTIKILLFIVYAFGTNSLSTSSQGLWQHGTSQLLLSAGMLLYLYNYKIPTAFILGLGVIARPTNLLSLCIFGLFEFIRARTAKDKIKTFFIYLIFGSLPLILEFYFNKMILGKADNAGYADQTSGWRNNIFEGFAGLWLSPSKGIFVNSPVFIFIFYYLYQLVKKFKKELLGPNYIYLISLIIVFFHTFVMGKWYSWYGGYSWGYRMASDVIPMITILILPYAIYRLSKAGGAEKLLFITLVIISVIIHLSSFVFFDGIWHTIYDGKAANWLWSISNSELVFDVKRALFRLKLGGNPFPIVNETPSIQ